MLQLRAAPAFCATSRKLGPMRLRKPQWAHQMGTLLGSAIPDE